MHLDCGSGHKKSLAPSLCNTLQHTDKPMTDVERLRCKYIRQHPRHLDRDSIVELVKWFLVKLYELVGNLRAKYA